MTQKFYNAFLTADMKALIADLSSAGTTVRAALTTSAYSPDITADTFFSDVTHEITGTGYTAGGAALASKTVTQDNVGNGVIFGAANTSWSSSTFTMHKIVLYIDTGTPSTSRLICYIDNGADISVTSGTFTITWDAVNGIFSIGQ